MSDQITICMTGPITATIRQLVAAYPGATANKIGRALVRLGLRHVLQNPAVLAQELRLLQAPCAGDENGTPLQHPKSQEQA